MTYFKTVPKILFALSIAALLTLVFVWYGTLYPFVFGKVWLFRILVEIMAVLYIPLFFTSSEYRPKRSFIWIALALFLGMFLVSGLLGASIYKSFWSNAERMEGLFGLLHYAAYAFILAGIFRSRPERLYDLMNVYMGVGVFSIIAAIFSAIDTGYLRLQGFAGNPSFLASQLIFGVLFGAMLGARAVTHKAKIAYMVSMFICLLGVFGTGTRGAFVGLVCGAFIFIAFSAFSRSEAVVVSPATRRIWGFRLLFVTLLLAFVAGGFWIWRGRGISLSDANTRSRLIAIRISINAWKEWPVFGWGPENYHVAFNKYIDPALIGEFRQRQWFDRAHNKILDILVMGGAVGVAAYAVFIGSLLYAFWRYRLSGEKEKMIAAVGIAGLAAYFVQNLFEFDVHQSYLPLFLLTAFLAVLTSKPANQQTSKPSTYTVPLSTALLISLIVIIPTVWYGSVKPLQSAMSINNALSIDPGVNPNAPKDISPDIRHRAIVGELQKAISQKSFVTWEALLLLERYYVGEVRAGNVAVDENLLVYLANRLGEAAVREPLKYEIYLALGEVLNIKGSMGDVEAYKEASRALEKAVEQAPNVPRVWYAKGTLHLGLNENIKGLEAFKKAVALNPAIEESHWTLGSAYLFLGEYQNAADAFDEAQRYGYAPQGIGDYKKLFEAYSETAQYEKVEKALLQLIELESQNAKWHAVLAATYKGMGRYDDARVEVQKAVALDGSYAKEAEVFLRTLEK